MTVLYDDTALTVCVKPVGVASQKSGDGRDMLSLLEAYYRDRGDSSTPYAVHRLDTAVGGVMVYAKTPKAAAALSREIAEGRFEKNYFAVVAGDVAKALGGEGRLCDLLFKDSRKNKSFVVQRKRNGVKEASLIYRVLGTREEEDGVLSLVEVRLITGRTHQIRVQFSSRGFPLVGDGKYGSRIKSALGLFSFAIGFRHPETDRHMCFELPLPDDAPFDAFQNFC